MFVITRGKQVSGIYESDVPHYIAFLEWKVDLVHRLRGIARTPRDGFRGAADDVFGYARFLERRLQRLKKDPAAGYIPLR